MCDAKEEEGGFARIIDQALRRIYRSRRWILALDRVESAVGLARRVHSVGGDICFVIGARGDPADGPAGVPAVSLQLPPASMMDALTTSEAALRNLPPDVQTAVDAADPNREARVLGAIFSDGRPVAGRRFFGARPLAWQALEDKSTIDALWDQIGVDRAPSEVAPVTLEALTAAAARLDAGAGTVWAGDSSQGFHGAGTYTVPVVTAEDAARAVAHLAPRCARARVMPFLPGIPCSIHGVVFPDHVVALRPAEMVMLRRPLGGRPFVYARAATFWDPPAADREAMRDLARRVGAHLRRTVGYRGTFTLDGVMTADGFRPTELNPRMGAAIGLMNPHLAFDLFQAALVEGEPFPLDGPAFEAFVLDHADTERRSSLSLRTERPVPEEGCELVWRGDRWVRAADDDVHDASASFGSRPGGGVAHLRLEPGRTPVGPSVAARVVAFGQWLDDTYQAGVGPLIPAREVRAPEP